MHSPFLSGLALVSLGFGGISKAWIWKRIERDPAGSVLFTDSLAYDSQGKLLAEFRSDPLGEAIHSIQYLYDDSGRSHQAFKMSPEERVIGETRCYYEGSRLTGWTRTEENAVMDGLHFQEEGEGRRTAHFQVGLERYRFHLDSRGRAERLAWLGGRKAWATFGYDAAGRHASTRFHGADSAFLGRDTLLRSRSGALRELRRYDAGGKLYAKVLHRYDARNQLTGKSYEEGGLPGVGREILRLPADSLVKLNRSVSSWKGPARTPICDFTWFRLVDLGIDMATLGGLALPQSAAAASLVPDWRAYNDSVDRERSKADREWEKIRSEVAACRKRPGPACLERARGELRRLAKGKVRGQADLEAVDSLAGLLLEKGGDAEYGRLLAGAGADTALSGTETHLIDRLLDYQVGKAQAGFCALPAPAADTVVRPGTRSVPAPSALPREWREAREFHRRLTRPIPDPDHEDTGSGRWSKAGLYRNVLDYLRTRDPEALRTAAGYRWGGWCGTGSEALHEPQTKLRLLHDLERGDLAAALRGTRDGEAQRRMLRCRDEDWERFFAGAAVHEDSDIRAVGIRILARYGSEESFRRLLALPLAGHLEGLYFPGLLEGLGMGLLGPGARLPSGQGAWAPPDFHRDPASPALPRPLREDILARLLAHIDSTPYQLDATTMVRILTRADFPRKGEYLRRLAAIPRPESRKEALAALAGMGIEAGRLPPLEPVTFTFTSRGKSFPDGSVNLALPCPLPPAPCPSWGAGSSIREGKYSLDRPSYLHAWHSARAIRFHHDYPGYDEIRDSRIFSVTVPLEEEPSGPVRVDIPLYSREYHLVFPPGFEVTPAKEMRLLLRRADKDGEAARSGSYPITLRLRRRLVLPALGEGTYSLALAVPGLRTWEADSLRVRADASDTLRLSAGSDVEYRVRHADSNLHVPVSVLLRHDDHGPVRRDALSRCDRPAGPVLGDTDRLLGLAPGRYTLELSALPGPGRAAVRAVKIFTLGEGSPALVRLGDILLR